MTESNDEISYYHEDYDLHNCNEEPLHKIHRVQAYSELIICDQVGGEWYYASVNAKKSLQSQTIADVVHSLAGVEFASISNGDSNKLQPSDSFPYQLLAHQRKFGWVLEFEPRDNLSLLQFDQEAFQKAILKISQAGSMKTFMDSVIEQVYEITGYDQIMIYQFEEDYSGNIIAERKLAELPSYLGLKFPKTDIPDQARALYLKEGIRVIADVDAEQTGIYINSKYKDKVELNLSGVTCRGVSPIHLEYLSNMGVKASFSVAIIKDNQLWGLVACHNRTPKLIKAETRGWLRFICDLIATNLDKITHFEEKTTEKHQQLVQQVLMGNIMNTQDLIEGLTSNDDSLQSLIESDGVILSSGDVSFTVGKVPDEEKVDKLISWVKSQGEFEVRTTSHSTDVPADIADPLWAGLLILQLSEKNQDYIIWSRQEKVRTVTWAGDINNTKQFDTDKGRMSPRKSFAAWQELVENASTPWEKGEVERAKYLKAEVKNFLYNKYNELTLIHKELMESYKDMETFSYSVSHDLRAPLRRIEGFTKIIREDYATSFDENGLKILDVITNSIARMNRFITDILKYSKLTKGDLSILKIDLDAVFKEQWMEQTSADNRNLKLTIKQRLPEIYGDLTMVSQLIGNLLGNAIKYVAKGVSPDVHVSFQSIEGYHLIHVDDNGIGIAPEKRESVFQVFTRLVREDEYDGSGVGMSIVKRVVDRHGGTVKITDAPGDSGGTRVSFSLPSNENFGERIDLSEI